MGGNRQRKSSSSFFSIFNIFSSKKAKGGYYDASDSGCKVWPSDYDKDSWWGPGDSTIDMKADIFIRNHKNRVSQSACCQLDPPA